MTFRSGSAGSIVSEGGSGVCKVVNGSPAWSESFSDVRSSASWVEKTPSIALGSSFPERA